MSERHLNWIGARWCASSTEQFFDLRSAGAPARSIGSFARSGACEVAQALALNQALGSSWFELAARERRSILARAAAALARDPDPQDCIAQVLGLEPFELAPHHQGLGALLERTLSGELAPLTWRVSSAGAACVLFAPGWSSLWREPARVLFSLLERGHGVLLVSDPSLPLLAHALAQACAQAGVPSGVVALLHDDGESVLRAALESSEIGAIVASGPPARMHRIEWLRRHLRADACASSASSHASLPFGAGVLDSSGARVELESLRNSTQLVAESDDPSQAAAFVFEHALGRGTALAGQLAGQIGRVLCHQRLFSRFSAELLQLCETHPDRERATALLEPATLAHVRRARELGLDEGATLLMCGSASRSPSIDADARLWPILFTNVEPHMRLAWLGRPSPVLCLMRVRDDAAGRDLKAQFDAWPSPEDLSTGSGASVDDAR